MQQPLVVLTLDGLTPAALGCYGSSWHATPVIDSLAAGGRLWDRCLVTNDDPALVLADLVSALHCALPGAARAELLIDRPAQLEAIATEVFQLMEVVTTQPTSRQQPAEDLIDTALGQLFAAALDRLTKSPLPDVVWMHSSYLAEHWDAPRHLFADELTADADESDEDAPPATFAAVTPPRRKLNGSEHPDLVTSWMRTYGCQVALLDRLLEPLVQQAESHGRMLVVAGTSGFRLGQGSWIGHRCGPLRSRDIHVPLLLTGGGPLRCPHLCDLPGSFSKIVRDCVDVVGVGASTEDRLAEEPRAMIATESARALAVVSTSEWVWVRDQDGADHLFFKPDDIEDFNDVARLRTDIVAELSAK